MSTGLVFRLGGAIVVFFFLAVIEAAELSPRIVK